MKDLLSDIRRENFPDVAGKLMNHYCVLKKDSRYDSDLIFRFAEIEFYLYDASLMLEWYPLLRVRKMEIRSHSRR